MNLPKTFVDEILVVEENTPCDRFYMGEAARLPISCQVGTRFKKNSLNKILVDISPVNAVSINNNFPENHSVFLRVKVCKFSGHLLTARNPSAVYL